MDRRLSNLVEMVYSRLGYAGVLDALLDQVQRERAAALEPAQIARLNAITDALNAASQHIKRANQPFIVSARKRA